MGTTPKPLTIRAHSSLADNDQLLKLSDQGHSIEFMADSPDLIIGPNCWSIPEGLESYIPMAIAAARKRRYPKKGG